VQKEVDMTRYVISVAEQLDRVVRFIDVFQNERGQYLIVMEKLDGGDLYERIISRQSFSERDAAVLMSQFVSALHQMHSKGRLIHRDLKIDNIVYCTKDEQSDIRIIDFGLSLIRPEESSEDDSFNCKTELAGTRAYIAPETIKDKLNRHYSAKTDIWSAGCILYTLLSGTTPFLDSDKLIDRKIAKGQYAPMNTTIWAQISEPAKDLVQKMLAVDPAQRYSALQVLGHPWIAEHNTHAPVVDLGQEYVRRMTSLSGKRKFKKVVTGIIWTNRLRRLTFQKAVLAEAGSMGSAHNDGESSSSQMTFSSSQLSTLQRCFIEALQRSVVSSSETLSALMSRGLAFDAFCQVVSESGLAGLGKKQIFDLFDSDGSGSVDYKEFLLTLASFLAPGEDKARVYFDIFDSDGSGSISLDELQFVMAQLISEARGSGDGSGDGNLPSPPPSPSSMEQGLGVSTLPPSPSPSASSPSSSPASTLLDDAASTRDPISELFAAIDSDGDGQISFEEFQSWLQRDPNALTGLVGYREIMSQVNLEADR
jgi:calcium-dependent protein kinase